jgi:M26 IgA1-specific Metallo-endopeptidase N-terminal region
MGISSVLVAGCAMGPAEVIHESESLGETSQAVVTTITTLAQLRAMSSTGDYVLGADIDASATAATPFVGIGTLASPFRGTFDGKTFKIKNLTISANGWYTGMFKIVDGATLTNIRLTNVNVPNSFPYTGAIAGVMSNTTLSDSEVSGTVKGADSTGGLVGAMTVSTVMNSKISGLSVTGTTSTGGFVGYAAASSFVTLCTSTNGSVKGTSDTGGFVGLASTSNVSFGTATGLNVTGTTSTGGLVGRSTGTIYGNSASGTVKGSDATGGIAGALTDGGLFATHVPSLSLTGGTSTGGLVGALTRGTVDSSSARGTITGTTNTGGLVGKMAGSQATRATLKLSYIDDKAAGDPSIVQGGTPTGMAVGLVQPYADLSQSYAIGKVTGSTYTVGGFIGEINAPGPSDVDNDVRANVYEIYTKVDVSPTFDAGTSSVYAGGLVGKLLGAVIEDINVAGSVKGRRYVGGAVGYAINSGNNVSRSVLRDTLTRGEVTNVTTANRSGLLGGEVGTFANCAYNYWDTTTDGGTAPPLPADEDFSCQLGKTATELKTPEKKYVDINHPNGNYDIFHHGELFTKANQAALGFPDCALGSGSDYDFGFAMCYGIEPWAQPPVWQLNSGSEYCTLVNIPNPSRQAKN